jgi:hypothetical protein
MVWRYDKIMFEVLKNTIYGGVGMSKGFIILGECILLIVVLLIIKIFVGNSFPSIADNNITSFVLYFISGMGSVLIYRLNTKNK